MARATCRCGQALDLPPEGVERVVCPKCEARVRIVRKRSPAGPGASSPAGDGFIRFSCPCGRRLKVSAAERPGHGKCPDCDRIVPVPAGATSDAAETPTQEMDPADVARLNAWAKAHIDRSEGSTTTAEMPLARRGGEAGLRVCPRCGKPIHLGADSCRDCGISVPKR